MAERTLTIGHIRKLIADLPDDDDVCMCDLDGGHLHCFPEQALINGGRLLLVPDTVYELAVENGDMDIGLPIPPEWLSDD